MSLPLICRKNRLLVFFCICICFQGCNPDNKNAKLKFSAVSDSTYMPDSNYKQALALWKNYYEKCVNVQLFPGAFYLQLQNKVYIGSINNQHELVVNKGIHILDTCNYKNIFNLLSVTNWSNCTDTIHLNETLRKDFYNEVVNVLSGSADYNGLIAAIDSSEMTIKLNSVANNTLIEDSLIKMLSATHDSSLIRFKELLLKPENVILGQTVEMLGFNAEFPLKKNLSGQQAKQLSTEVFFTINSSNDRCNLILNPDNTLRIQINKRYTVLGSFLKLKAE